VENWWGIQNKENKKELQGDFVVKLEGCADKFSDFYPGKVI